MVKFTFPLPSKRFEQGRHLNCLTCKTITLLNWYKIGLKTLHQPKDPWKVPWRLLLNLCILFPPSNNWLLKRIFLDVSFVLNIFIVLGLGSYGETGLWDHTLAGPQSQLLSNSEDLGKTTECRQPQPLICMQYRHNGNNDLTVSHGEFSEVNGVHKALSMKPGAR